MLRTGVARVVARMVGVGLFAAALAACARDCGPFGPAWTEHASYREAADQARQRLAETCMSGLSGRSRSATEVTPQCRCYARDMLKRMSPAEVNVIAVSYTAPPAQSAKVMAACATRVVAAQKPRPQPAKPPDPAPSAEPAQGPSADEAPESIPTPPE
jgi:hypothetical protein